MKKYPVTAAVLAGGKNSRLSQEKSLIAIDGTTLLDNTLDILDSLFKEVLIVTNKKMLIDRYPQRRIVRDIYEGRGPIGGIHSVLLHSSFPLCFVCACDMPNLSRALMEKMVEFAVSNDIKSLLIASHSEGFEPLHSIYRTTIIKTVENQIEKDELKISKMFDLLDTDYYIIPHALIRSLANINTENDLYKLTVKKA